MSNKNQKRVFDVTLSLLLIIISLPLVSFIALILIFVNKGNPFILQRRPGMNEIEFILFKFKTMNDNKDINGNLLPDEKRLTFVGRLLRTTSLDELPQLINVLKGDMSLVGPRPLLTKYIALYSERQARRHEVRPGITGWAQVNGRNAITWEEKLELDVWYVENQSMTLDIKILLMTIKKVIIREGISLKGHATMPEFKGNHERH